MERCPKCGFNLQRINYYNDYLVVDGMHKLKYSQMANQKIYTTFGSYGTVIGESDTGRIVFVRDEEGDLEIVSKENIVIDDKQKLLLEKKSLEKSIEGRQAEIVRLEKQKKEVEKEMAALEM